MSIAFDCLDGMCSGWLADQPVDEMGKVPFCMEGRGPHLVFGLPVLCEVVLMSRYLPWFSYKRFTPMS